MQWHIKIPAKYIMVQWGWPIFFSLGIHIDPRARYIDLHIIFFILTIGNPKVYEQYLSWWSSRSI